MAAIKAQNANAFVSAPDPKASAILFYGPDAGLVSERAQRVARLLADREKPPGEIIRIDDGDLDEDPDRLAVELLTVPMFGGRKIVRASTGRRINAVMLKSILEGSPLAGWLIVEAGNLRADEPLRALFEKSPSAAAVPCYADEARDLTGIIGEILETEKLSIAPDAQHLLLARLGADRGLSRSEVEKLAIYASGKGRIEVEDVEAIVGDAAELAMDRLINAAALGQAERALVECDRAVAAGESPQAVIAAAQRHFFRLHRTRVAVDNGRTLDDVIRTMRPPLYFKQRQIFEAQCRQWTAGRLQKALSLIEAAAKAARLSSAMETVLAERLLLDLATLGGTDGRRQRA